MEKPLKSLGRGKHARKPAENSAFVPSERLHPLTWSLPQVSAHPYHTTATFQPLYHRRGLLLFAMPQSGTVKNVTVFYLVILFFRA